MVRAKVWINRAHSQMVTVGSDIQGDLELIDTKAFGPEENSVRESFEGMIGGIFQ